MGLSLDNLNPFTGFGLLDTGLEYLGTSELQEDAQAFDAQQFAQAMDFEREMFGEKSDFAREMQKNQFNQYLDSIQASSGRMVAGLKEAGINPILAATGGFRAQGVSTGSGSASTSGVSPGRSSGGKGPSSRSAEALKMSKIVDSTANLNNSAANLNKQKEETERSLQEKNRADASRSLSETDKITLENNKRSFFSFFWENFDGQLRNFDRAFNSWAKKNGDKVDSLLDKLDMEFEDLKRNMRKSYPGNTGGRNRRNR